MDSRTYWETVYGGKQPDEVSWYEPVPRVSLELIDEAGVPRDARLIDAGGGESRLAGELLDRGYLDVTVADISGTALAEARRALGERAGHVTWIEADLGRHEFERPFDLWHDRAVFHFMLDDEDRDAYLDAVRRGVAPAGQLIIATFGPEGPPTCSGLPVRRYDAEDLAALLPDFELASERHVVHRTPGGNEQQFLYGRFVRSS